MKLRAYKGKSVPEVADIVRKIASEHNVPMSRVIADEDGVGGGVVDILKCKGFVNGSSPIEILGKKPNFANLKSQCYYALADRINKSGLYIDCDDTEIRQTIIEELEQVKKKDVDKDGKNAVVPKEKVKEILGRSPDFADTLMMREYFELKPKFELITL